MQSGPTALSLLDGSRYDVLISDIAMPEMDGYEFVRTIRVSGNRVAERIPAIALTAFSRSEDRRRAMLAALTCSCPSRSIRRSWWLSCRATSSEGRTKLRSQVSRWLGPPGLGLFFPWSKKNSKECLSSRVSKSGPRPCLEMKTMPHFANELLPAANNRLLRCFSGTTTRSTDSSIGFPGIHSEAEDIAQETFIKAARSLGQFGGRSSFKNWLYSIAMNTLRDNRRSALREEKARDALLQESACGLGGWPRRE